ncbi:DNA repair ATPase [Streptomyces solincola]|nr:DNA repair ATPase [Streptomyces solincola]
MTAQEAGPAGGAPLRADHGAHEVLRDRLRRQAGELARRAEALEAARVAAYGAGETVLTGSGRLRTRDDAVPGDLIAVGGVLLAGYRTGTPADVFALYDRDLAPLPDTEVPGLLDDPAFVREHQALHRYFKDARLVRLRRVEDRLLAVFRTGERAEDLRVLRWSLTADGAARFLDARGERDHTVSEPHDFAWTGTTRDDHRPGRHPHIAVAGGALFVSAAGGALTLKTEDDTERAEGVYEEPVDEPLQSLADAEVAYAVVGPLVLLRVRPYKEEQARHLVVHTPTGAVARLDAVGRSCHRLPDDQGVVFPGGYCLATGEVRTFDTARTDGLRLERVVRSPGGDQVLYAFHAHAEGRALLLPYDPVRRRAAAPMPCHGYALADDGRLILLRPEDGEPGRRHPVRIWRTPFATEAAAEAAAETAAEAADGPGGGPLARIGNADLVRGVSDCLALARQAADAADAADAAGDGPGEPYAALVAACARAAERHPWLGEPGTGDLDTPLAQVRATAQRMLDERAAVRELADRAAAALAEAAAHLRGLVRRARGEAADAGEWIDRITALRRARGRLTALREQRYADTAAVDALAERTGGHLADTARRAVDFLGRADAFAGHHERAAELVAEAGALATAAGAGPLADELDEQTAGLRALTETVTGLDAGDATVRTAVLERIAEVLAALNRARAVLTARRRELTDAEDRAAYAAECGLLAQAVGGALAAAATPQACDTELAGLLVRLDALESRFAGHEGRLAEIADRRAEVQDAFAARRQSLLDERVRRAERLAASAHRVLAAVARRAAALAGPDDAAALFAADPMVAGVRRSAAELRDLGDTARAEELEGRLTAVREETARTLRDRAELYADGGATLRLGAHRFTVTTRPPELTLLPGPDGVPVFALTGTDYRAPVEDPGFADTRPYWDRHLPSEDAEVYRGEHLAARLLAEHGAAALAADPARLPELVRRAAAAAYDEGYERGVHDHDAAVILDVLVRLHRRAGLLRHPAADRAAAQTAWAAQPEEVRRARARQAASLARARDVFGTAPGLDALRRELAEDSGLDEGAAAYLVEELATGESFVAGPAARALLTDFRRAAGDPAPYAHDVRDRLAAGDLAGGRRLVEGWLTAYAAARAEPPAPGDLAEAVAMEVCPDLTRYDPGTGGAPVAVADGLLGVHPRIERGALTVRLDEFLARTARFAATAAPGFRAYQRRRAALLEAERRRLRLEDHRPRPLPGFVRGRLVDEVYLPLVGGSLAGQLGTAGRERTGSGGLLLLLSPPGYGKTTLVEYVAERLGLLLVKVDGPALGQATTSLDPAAAPDASARRELEKIAFALRAADNVLLYLDDIQHTSPELLQRFVPLCDATRTLDGHDLRGKRFAVCMAGNPYTESGRRFRVPDMLANRAHVWNLGDALTGKEDAFALSFVENALTSQPDLAPLAARDRADLELLVRLAEGDPTAARDRLAHPYPPAELDRVLAVLRHLLAARRTVLAVNAAYLASAAQGDAARAEPPFRLQGSYRDMNRIAARISPVMDGAELAAVVDDHYTAQAATLAAGAEADLLKLAALRGPLTARQAARWAEITAAHARERALGGAGDDAAARAVAALGLLADRVAAVESAITRAAEGG